MPSHTPEERANKIFPTMRERKKTKTPLSDELGFTLVNKFKKQVEGLNKEQIVELLISKNKNPDDIASLFILFREKAPAEFSDDVVMRNVFANLMFESMLLTEDI